MEGWLEKKAVRTATKLKWKKRYFRVDTENKTLGYYKSPSKKNPILLFKITDETKVCIRNKHHANEMEVIFEAHTLYAHSIDPENPTADIKRWVDAIQAVIDSLDQVKLGQERLAELRALEEARLAEEQAQRGKLKSAPIHVTSALSTLAQSSNDTKRNPDRTNGKKRREAPAPPPRPTTPEDYGGGESRGQTQDSSSQVKSDPFGAFFALVKRAEQDIAKCYTWGSNNIGQGGTGELSQTGRVKPHMVEALRRTHLPVQVDAGRHHVVAATRRGLVFAWGDGEKGQLGQDKPLPKTLRPLLVRCLSTVVIKAVACGESHSLALSESGDVYAWGTGIDGQLGLGEVAPGKQINVELRKDSACKIPTLGEAAGRLITSIYAGARASAAICEDGSSFVWGDNVAGQLGTGLDTIGLNIWEPQSPLIDLKLYAVDGDDELCVREVALGDRFTLWRINDGVLLQAGAIGLSSQEFLERQSQKEWVIRNCDTPHLLDEFGESELFDHVACGSHMAIAITQHGRVFSAGRGYLAAPEGDPSVSFPVVNHKCQMRMVQGRRVPTDEFGNEIHPSYGVSQKFVPVVGLPRERWAGAAVGALFTILRTRDGRLFGWGDGKHGQLCLGGLLDYSEPVEMTFAEIDGSHYSQVACGESNVVTLALPYTTGKLREHYLSRKYARKWYEFAFKREAEENFGNRPQTNVFKGDVVEHLDHMMDELSREAGLSCMFSDPSVAAALKAAMDS